jgi:hypothetical protein
MDEKLPSLNPDEKLPSLNPKDVIKALKKVDFSIHHQTICP